jgi:Arylsulfotransferase (ASST)
MLSTSTHLVDPRGRVVHSWNSQYTPGQSVYLLPNGNLLRGGKVSKPSTPSGGDGGIVEEFDWDNNLVWSYTLSTTTEILHHDITRLPNGNTLMVVWDYKTQAEAVAAGRNPVLLKDGYLWPDKIIEVAPTGKTTGTIVWQWHVFDHLVQDYDSTKANYGDPAKHPELVDINYAPNPVSDWMHTNAIDYNARLDQVMISVRSFDEFWVIDHSTTTQEAASHSGGRSGKGGDLLYRWGNPLTYRAGTSKDQRLFKQHHAHWIPDGLPGAGNVLLFNNGEGRPEGAYSTADEIALPQVDLNGNYPMTGSAWGPAAALWSYKAAVPTSFFSQYVSSAQRLANGNTFICGGWIGRMREVDSNGKTLWEYVNPLSASGPGVQGDLTGTFERPLFRAPYYAPGYSAFQNRKLVPGEPLELHPAVLLQDGSTTPRVARTGTSVALSLRAGHLPGHKYLVATSASDGLISVDNRFLRMGWDAVLEASIFGLAPATFQGYAGVLDNQGRASANLAIPANPALKGLKVYTTMLVIHPLAPTTLGMISNTVVVEIDA